MRLKGGSVDSSGLRQMNMFLRTKSESGKKLSDEVMRILLERNESDSSIHLNFQEADVSKERLLLEIRTARNLIKRHVRDCMAQKSIQYFFFTKTL